MDSFSRKEIVIGRLKFITMSLIGILLFRYQFQSNKMDKSKYGCPSIFTGVLKNVSGGVMPL